MSDDPGLMTRSGAGSSASCSCAITTARRRALLAASVGLGVGLAARMAGAQTNSTRDRPKPGDLLVRVGTTQLTPLGPDSVPLGAGQVLAWPMDPVGNIVRDRSRLNKVLLVRLDPAVLDPQTGTPAADGVVAYSAICPHTGCEVVNWSADRQILECPCNNSQYDAKEGARSNMKRAKRTPAYQVGCISARAPIISAKCRPGIWTTARRSGPTISS
jgi:rieske iron-sulfur protein